MTITIEKGISLTDLWSLLPESSEEDILDLEYVPQRSPGSGGSSPGSTSARRARTEEATSSGRNSSTSCDGEPVELEAETGEGDLLFAGRMTVLR